MNKEKYTMLHFFYFIFLVFLIFIKSDVAFANGYEDEKIIPFSLNGQDFAIKVVKYDPLCWGKEGRDVFITEGRYSLIWALSEQLTGRLGPLDAYFKIRMVREGDFIITEYSKKGKTVYYIKFDGKHVKIFSSSNATSYIFPLIQEASKKTEREKVKIEVETFPELFPVIAKFLAEGNQCFKIPHLVRWKIWNNSNQIIKITVTAEIPEWTPPVIKTVTLAPNEFKEVSQTPFGIALLRNYSIIPATLILRAKKEGKIIYEETRSIKIRAADEVIWSLYTPYDTEYMIAAWVTPKDPAIEEILSIAKEKLYTRSLSGYMGDVKSQVRAIFNAVRDMGISYVSSTLSFGQIGFTQRVRLPRESIAQRAINCIDGAVLFASLFENIGLEPLIILTPSHAFVGVRLAPGSQETLFIETTLVGRPIEESIFNLESTFDAAVRVGTEEYMKLLYQSRYNPNILHIIDIKKAREMGIYPLW